MMENINVTAYVSGIAHPQRMEWLRKTIDHMDSQEFPFRRKILTIDQFDGHTVKTEELTHFISRGWRIFSTHIKVELSRLTGHLVRLKPNTFFIMKMM